MSDKVKLLVIVGGTQPRAGSQILADADVAVAIWREDHELRSEIVKDREGNVELTVRHGKLP